MKILNNSFLFLSIVIIFVLVFLTPGIMIPVSDKILKRLNPNEMKLFFPLLILFAIYISITYWMVINNTDQNKLTLFLKLLLALFIIYPLMGLLESLFWRDAFKGIGTEEFLKIFCRYVITITLFSVYLSIISKNTTLNKDYRKKREGYKSISKKILLISLLYFVVYNLFGYFIAWQFEATRIFYTGNTELKNFFSAMIQNVSDPKFVLVHIFRGMLFGLSGYIFHTILSGSKNKILVIMSLIFGGFGFQIILSNPLFPEMVRISHFIETTLSMILFGALVGDILNNKCNKKIQRPLPGKTSPALNVVQENITLPHWPTLVTNKLNPELASLYNFKVGKKKLYFTSQVYVPTLPYKNFSANLRTFSIGVGYRFKGKS